MDQITKFWAVSFLSLGESLPLFPEVFHLTLVYNTGIAFGFFRHHQSLLFILITLSLIFLFLWGLRIHSARKSQASVHWGLGLILGGALGNWIDRLRLGAVIDFLDFRIWPVFNLADSAITIGVCWYMIRLLLRSHPP